MEARHIAYLINQYPMISHSFIRREIQALERLGMRIERFALRGWNVELVDESDESERGKTRYLLKNGLRGLLPAVMRTSIVYPLRCWAALKLALRMAVGSEASLPYHLVYFAEACLLAEWLRRAQVQHLHAHFGTNSAEVAMLASLLTGIPYSLTIHGPEEFDRPMAIGLPEKLKRSAFVVAISSYGCSQLYRWMDAKEWDKVHVVHCGLEPAFHAAPVVMPLHAHRLLYVGRFSEQKGLLLLLRAAHLLLRKSIDFELVLAGDGELRGKIESLIDELSLSERVTITGWVSSGQVREHLLASRALVVSSFAEGLPVVIMEAMALCRPVLSTHIAGIPELVRDGKDGWLFPAGSVTALATAMESCLATPLEVINRMGEHARNRVLERHDIDIEVRKLAFRFAHVIQPISAGGQHDEHIAFDTACGTGLDGVAHYAALSPSAAGHAGDADDANTARATTIDRRAGAGA